MNPNHPDIAGEPATAPIIDAWIPSTKIPFDRATRESEEARQESLQEVSHLKNIVDYGETFSSRILLLKIVRAVQKSKATLRL